MEGLLLKKTVLITGAGGLIGSVLREALADRYNVRPLARRQIPDVETIIADITDLEAMLAACEGVDSIVHMAASASFTSTWDQVLSANIIGTYNVYEAGRKRASSRSFSPAQITRSGPSIWIMHPIFIAW